MIAILSHQGIKWLLFNQCLSKQFITYKHKKYNMHHIKIHYRTLKFNNFNKNVKDRENLRYIVICDYAIYIILTIKATRREKYFVCTIFSSVCVVKLYVQINIEVFNPLIIYCTFCILLLFISSTFFIKTNHSYCTFFLVSIQDRCLQVN